MELVEVEDPGREWEAFVEEAPGAVLGHAAPWWRVLRESYGLEPRYLAARDDEGRLAGVLPLVRFRTLRGGVELVSLPFLDAAGVLARDEAAERVLLEGAGALARELGASALELRQMEPLRTAPAPPSQDRVDLAMPLEASEEAQWKALRAKVRNQTRKAERSDLVPGPREAGRSLADFYAPFAVNMRDLGSPVHARRFFEVCAEAWGERMSVHTALLDGRSVGGLVALHHGDTVTIPWASTLRSERARCPNNLIYWEAIRWAIARGARELDLGRSPRGEGTHRFKLGWGATERELAWLRLGPGGERLAPATVGSALRRLSGVWSRLPVPLATAIGPRLRRFLSN